MGNESESGLVNCISIYCVDVDRVINKLLIVFFKLFNVWCNVVLIWYIVCILCLIFFENNFGCNY